MIDDLIGVTLNVAPRGWQHASQIDLHSVLGRCASTQWTPPLKHPWLFQRMMLHCINPNESLKHEKLPCLRGYHHCGGFIFLLGIFPLVRDYLAWCVSIFNENPIMRFRQLWPVWRSLTLSVFARFFHDLHFGFLLHGGNLWADLCGSNQHCVVWKAMPHICHAKVEASSK
jgi:hypothetical protein